MATQIATVVADAKSEMTGLVTEAELRWQARLDEQAEVTAGTSSPLPELEALRTELAQGQAEANEKRTPRMPSLSISSRDSKTWRRKHDAQKLQQASNLSGAPMSLPTQ